MDWDRQSEWVLGTRVGVTGGDGSSVGSTVAAVTGVGPLGVRDTMEIVEWRPPRRCVVRHTGRIVRGLGVFEVTARNGGGSVFSWTEELELPLGVLGRLGWPLVRPAMHGALALSMSRFARLCAGDRRGQ